MLQMAAYRACRLFPLHAAGLGGLHLGGMHAQLS